MTEQNSNPFEDFQPSWLKARPSATPVSPDKEAEDILLQEVVAPLRTSSVNGFETVTSSIQNYAVSDPAAVFAAPISPANTVPGYANEPTTTPVSVSSPPDSLPPSLEALRGKSVKTKSQVASGKNPNLLLWLMATVGLVVFLVLAYAIFVALQGGERQANSQPATDVGEMSAYPDSYMISLNPAELNPFVAKASLALSKINKQACFRSPSNMLALQQFYETRMPTKKYVPQGMMAEGVPQTEAWRDAKGINGTAVGTINIGYFDFSYFNRAEPGQTVFCLFSGQAATRTDEISNAPGATITINKTGPLPAKPLNTPVPTSPENNDNPPSINNNPTPNNPQLPVVITTNNDVTSAPVEPPANLPTPTPKNPLDMGA